MQSWITFFFFTAGKTELAKQVARFFHQDNKKVNDLSRKSFFLAGHTSTTFISEGRSFESPLELELFTFCQ